VSPLRLAWLNLARHRAATVLVLFSLGLTVACAGMLLRTARLAETRFGTLVHAGDALVAAKGGALDALLGALNLEGPYPRFIPMRLFATLVNEAWHEAGNQSHASSIVPAVFCGKHAGRQGVYRVLGTTPGLMSMPRPAPAMTLLSGAWPVQNAGAVIGADVARRERLSLGDTIRVAHWSADNMPAPGTSGGLRPRRFRVAGVLAPMDNAWDQLILTNLVQAENMMAEALPVAGEMTAWGSLVLHYLIVHANPGGLDSLTALVDQKTVAQVVPVRETRASLERITGTGRKIGVVVALLALLLAMAALAAVMLGRFEGLSRQTAVLEGMGWRRSALRTLLAWEGLLLGLGAVLIGGLLDAALFPLLRILLAGAVPNPDIVMSTVWESAPVWAAALGTMIGASLASSLFLFRGRAQERLRGLG
jgi:predicted lysophospholipase L1 biosynthesis ABC-type transport system permease subunit